MKMVHSTLYVKWLLWNPINDTVKHIGYAETNMNKEKSVYWATTMFQEGTALVIFSLLKFSLWLL